mgnify:CR=1 FL=1
MITPKKYKKYFFSVLKNFPNKEKSQIKPPSLEGSKRFFWKFFLIFVISVLSVSLTLADRVGVVMHFPDNSIFQECVQIPKDTNGYDLIQKMNIQSSWAGPSSFGHQLCKVNGIGEDVSGNFCSFSGKYWRFLFLNKQWQYMPVGVDGGSVCWNNDLNSFNGHYCALDRDVIGFSFGAFDDTKPKTISFEQICDPLDISNINIYVDGKKQKDADEDGGDIEIKPGSKISIDITMENNYQFDDELTIKDIEAELTIKDIDQGSDVSISKKFKSLDVDESDKNSLEFSLPFTIENDKFDGELKITGKTSAGIKQLSIIEYTFESIKERNDILIEAELKQKESCFNNENNIHIKLTNIGEKDEKAVTLTVSNLDLSINFKDTFNLDEGIKNSIYEKDIPFIISSLQQGEYPINISVDGTNDYNEELTIIIKDCSMNENNHFEEETTNTIKFLSEKELIPKDTVYNKSFLQKYLLQIILLILLLILIIIIFALNSMLR